ncbi:MAG: hypothetical protein ACM3S0_07685 [Acidobacteriota bacterium]
MPSLADLQFLSGSNALIGLIVTAALIVLLADWRLALFALAFQYVLLGLLLTSLVSPGVAIVRIISGGLAATILFLTMRHRAYAERAVVPDSGAEEPAATSMAARVSVFIVGWPFRFFAVALVAVAIIGFSSSMTLLGLRPFVLFSSLWLMAIGVLIAMVSRDVLRLGLGILAFTGGFSILDTAMENSLFLYALLNIADLLIALGVAHLASLSSDAVMNRRRGDLP